MLEKWYCFTGKSRVNLKKWGQFSSGLDQRGKENDLFFRYNKDI